MTRSRPIHLLDKRVALRQPEGGFRPGLDSVMLAAACKAKEGDNILDLGCGVGSAGLCILARVAGAKLTGIDIIEDLIKLAEENATLNNVQNKTTFIVSSVTNFSPSPLRGEGRGEGNKNSKHPHPSPLPQGRGDVRYDHVICNPPFLEAGSHSPSPDEKRALANGHDDEVDLEDWLKCAFENLKSGGSLTLIHRADQTDKIIRGLGKSYGAIEIIPLWPKAGVPAKRVIIRALKHRKSPAIINPGLVLHQENGDYTAAAEAILRGAEAL